MRYYILSIFFLSIYQSYSQNTARWNSSKIYNEIEKLNFLGSALYVAAHPDDENTGLISYLANKEKAHTAYLSLTRGDGGQNLIGNELREDLGLIRSQELLEARKIDGGKQYFTRANDFGFSKNPTETLQIWDKQQVLHDITYIIRFLKPDVIITRFDYRTPGSTHGHHTSSALLAKEAFNSSNSVKYFPDQLKKLSPWQAQNLYINISPFFYKTFKDFENAPKNNFLTVKTGNYYKNLGVSNSEIAAWSRSKHRSQGFGTLTKRGDFNEYLEPIFTKIKPSKSIFDGIDTSWNRIENSYKIQEKLNLIIKEYDYNAPENSIKELINLYDLIEKIDNAYWKSIKLNDLKTIILQCAGLYFDFYTTQKTATPGEKIYLYTEIIAQNFNDVEIKNIKYKPLNKKLLDKVVLKRNIEFNEVHEIEIPKLTRYTSPQWINSKSTNGMYFYEDDSWLETPDVIRDQTISFEVTILGRTFTLESNIICKVNDPSIGEIKQNLNIIPEISLSFDKKQIIKKDSNPFNIKVVISGHKDINNLKVHLEDNKNYDVYPKHHLVENIKKNQSISLEFTISPKSNGNFEIKALATANNVNYNQELITIDYPHILNHVILKETKSNLHVLNINTNPLKIGYILGAGDEVWKGIQEMGYDIEIINEKNLNYNNLNKYNCIILGIRAYNLIKSLETHHSDLMKFVENGGTLISQYNTVSQLNFKDFAPYPLKISSNRITDENAEVTFIEPNHSVLNYPNKIVKEDFLNWVQEQGLYYPDSWDVNFKPILKSKDPGSDHEYGALLVAKYGKGYYIYTGLSFFRQIPNGVTGAYKLLSNLIEIKEINESK